MSPATAACLPTRSMTSRCSAALREEAAQLRQQLTADRLFRMHAQHLVYHRAILRAEAVVNVAEVVGKLSLIFTAAALCAIHIAPRGWRSGLVRTGVAATVVLGGCMLGAFRSLRSLVDPRHPPPEIPPPETRQLTERLTRFLDGADGAPARALDQPSPGFLAATGRLLSGGHKPVDAYYESLPPYRRKIRLLILRKGEFFDKLEGSLYISDVGYPYEALSYVWGGDDSWQEIMALDGKPFPIRQNLAAALRHIRRTDRDRMLWVDAISINQRDGDERNRQVAMMSDIYERAQSVVVFLGVEDDDTERSHLFDFFDALRAAEADEVDSVLAKTDLPVVLDQFWALLQKPWWSRVWVVQEFAYAQKDPVLVFGTRQTDARTFWRGLDLLRERLRAKLYRNSDWLLAQSGEEPPSSASIRGDGADSLADNWHTIQMRYSLLSWRTRLHPVMANLSDLLTTTRAHRATLPVDHVFALNSLMMEPFRSALRPDYRRTIAEAYTRMAACLLCIQPWADLYNFFPIGGNPDWKLPSWVPDFSQAVGVNVHSDRDRLWRLAPRISPIGQVDCCVSDRVLTARGIDCGAITSVEALVPDEEGLPTGFLTTNLTATPAPAPAPDSHPPTETSSSPSATIDESDEHIFNLMAAFEWDPNKPPFITPEDVAEMLQALPPETRIHLLTTLLLRSFGIGTGDGRFAYPLAGFNQDIVDLVEQTVRLVRRNRRRRLQREEAARLARLARRGEGDRFEPARIVEDLRTDERESAEAAARVGRAAAEFERRVFALRRGAGPQERDPDSAAVVAAAVVAAAARLESAFVRTDGGVGGLVPAREVRVGDRLVMLHGVASLFVARPRVEEGGEGDRLFALVDRVIVVDDPAETVRKGVEDGVFAENMMSFR